MAHGFSWLPTLLAVGLSLTAPSAWAGETSRDGADADDSTDDGEGAPRSRSDEASSDDAPRSRSDEAPPDDAPRSQSDEAPSWQIGIALNALSYQRASFDVEPLNSGRTFPGTLERTNVGPSGSSIFIEPGYVLGNRLVLGILLDIGSSLNELEVKGLSFRITQSAASFAVGPRVAYLFAPTSKLRPMAMLAFGYTTTPSEISSAQALRITEYQGFAGVGLSYFASRFFSFDSSLRVAYGIGSGYADSPPLEDASLSGSVFTALWTFGTSGWLM